MINPGDKVVCVNDRSPCCGDAKHAPSHKVQPVVGRYYIVSGTEEGICGQCGAILPSLTTPELDESCPNGVWPQAIFRKVIPANKDIFRLASAPKIKEPA